MPRLAIFSLADGADTATTAVVQLAQYMSTQGFAVQVRIEDPLAPKLVELLEPKKLIVHRNPHTKRPDWLGRCRTTVTTTTEVIRSEAYLFVGDRATIETGALAALLSFHYWEENRPAILLVNSTMDPKRLQYESVPRRQSGAIQAITLPNKRLGPKRLTELSRWFQRFAASNLVD